MKEPACVKCESADLVFIEHAGDLTIYQCARCGSIFAVQREKPRAK